MASTSLTIPRSAVHAIQLLGEREEQEDSYGLIRFGRSKDAGFGIIVADGMGGHVGGPIASQTVVDSARLILEDTDALAPAVLLEIAQSCNASVGKCVELNPEFEGMGSTLITALLVKDWLHWVSVGDSCLYSFSRATGLSRVNEDHSMKPVLDKMLEEGALEISDEEYSSKKNMLRSAITGADLELVDCRWQGISLASTDLLIIASDGLETLADSEIEAVCKRLEAQPVTTIANNLIDAVTRADHPRQDNTTLIIVRPCELGF
jgi:serine/threonine protein phosphatase PrpC